jgi:hypothetical protein
MHVQEQLEKLNPEWEAAAARLDAMAEGSASAVS